jgi:hypothetical protein
MGAGLAHERALGWKMRVLGRNMASEADQLAGDGVHKPWQGTERQGGHVISR